ncbi:MAG: MBL fold metallo-hydrolase [Candidatus Nanopelagicaceae bacterium]|nr:MBL fold metallo-hydrolase [Candidatus Nanopelagicaceae bacterium]
MAGAYSWKLAIPLFLIVLLAQIRSSRYAIFAWSILVGCGIYSLHLATLQQSFLAQIAQDRGQVVLHAKVTSDIKSTGHKVRGSNLHQPQNSFLVRATKVQWRGQESSLRLPVRVLSKFNSTIGVGDEILLSGHLILTKEKRVAATIIADEAPEALHSAGKLSKLLSDIREEFRKKASRINSDAGSLIPGMILGDTTLQSQSFATQMRRSGLSHLTAVSGANFAIVSALVFWISRLIFKRLIIQLLITSGFLVIFLLLVRPSPSVLRAGVMAAVILLARATGNRRNAASALAAAITALLLLDPFQSQDPGFVLSVLATGGLIFLAPEISSRLEKWLPGWLAEILAVSLAATVLCTPYILFLSGEISALSVLFNVLVAPSVAPITIMGFLSVILLPITWLSNLLLTLAASLAKWIALVASFSLATPTLRINPIFFLSVILIGLLLYKAKRNLLFLALALIVLINLSPRLSFPGSGWQIAQCDVGQGDALAISLGHGAGLLFDVGPDPTLIDRCLKTLKINKLPLIVLSHDHADHTFGLAGAMRNRSVGEIWSNGGALPPETLNSIIRVVKLGDSAKIGDTDLEVLWPKPYSSSSAQYQNLPGDGSAENNRSLVIKVIHNGVSILVTGDIEPEAQSEIAAQGALSAVDILKVAHHGSRFQDQGFLRITQPKVALISVGRGNSYGHPDVSLINSLLEMGSVVRRTDLHGPIAVGWRFDSGLKRYIFTIREMRKEWWRVQWR